MFVKNIHPNIQGTLKAKEKAFAREDSEVHFEDGTSYKLNFNDIASRSVFIRMISNRAPDELEIIQGGDLGFTTDDVGNVLDVKTKFGYNHVYRKKSDGQIRPISGIKDISVEYKGGYKAIRQATVNWVASSLDDLDRFITHFLSIGQSVLLDWGWVYKNQEINNYISSNTFFDSSTNKIDTKVFSNPVEKIYQSGGNYDAIGGTISNMNYKLNEDGGFDCTTVITSVGINLFEAKRIDKEPDAFSTKQNEEGTIADDGDGIINAILNLPRILVHDYMGVPARTDDWWTNLDAALWTGRTLNQYIDNRHETYKNRDYLGKNVHKYFDEIISTNNLNDAGARMGESGGLLSSTVGDIVATFTGFMYPRDNYVLVKAGEYFEKSDKPNKTKNDKGKVEVIISKLTVADKSSQFYVYEKEVVVSRHDMYVRWGWFEDNILSRYSSYIDSDDELFNVFRSIEPQFDARGQLMKDENGEIVMQDVFINNDPEYLLPLDPLKFILTGQVLNSDYLTLNTVDDTGRGEFGTDDDDNDWSKIIGGAKVNYDFLTSEAFDKLMSINYSNEYSYKNYDNARLETQGPGGETNSDSGNYGKLRNIMINVKEIQKAFGIEGIDDYASPGEIFGSDKINPAVGIKEGMQKLCDALSSNFHNFWKFEIVEDPFTKNMKVIEADSFRTLKSKKYTEFDATKNTKVKNLGIFKFPSFQKGSFVKSQDLEFKIPDSMAVTAMYGMNKNMGNKSPIDTSQNGAELSALSLIQTNGIPVDDKYKNMQIAYTKTGKGGSHEIGNSKEGSVKNNKITLKGGFKISPGDTNLWWNRYSSKSAESHKEIDKLSADEQLEQIRLEAITSIRKSQLKTNFYKSLANILNDSPNNSKAIMHQNLLQELSKTPPQEQSEADRNALKNLRKQLRQASTRFYTVVAGDDDDFEFNLFPAGISFLHKNLFELNSNNVEKKKNFLIPAELNLEIDGTSGITPGDILQTDYIPSTYTMEREGMPVTFFQTFEVSQKVGSDGWTTEFNGKMRVNTETLKELIGPTSFPIQHTEITVIENKPNLLNLFEEKLDTILDDVGYEVAVFVDETADAAVAVGKQVYNKAGKIIDDPIGELQKAAGTVEDLAEDAKELALQEYEELEKKVKAKGLVKGVWDYGKELFK